MHDKKSSFIKKIVTSVVGILLLFWCVFLCEGKERGDMEKPIPQSRILLEMLEASKEGKSFVEMQYEDKHLTNEDFKFMKDYIHDKPDYTAYHFLVMLKLRNLNTYKTLSPEKRAQILCSTLSNTKTFNDWGYLDITESFDKDIARELISLKKPAVDCLISLLQNKEPAFLFGSEESTMSEIFQYRRCDFAFRYICLIVGYEYTFKEDPSDRDEEIKQLLLFLKTKDLK